MISTVRNDSRLTVSRLVAVLGNSRPDSRNVNVVSYLRSTAKGLMNRHVLTFSTAAALSRGGPETTSTCVGSLLLAANVKVTFTAPSTRAVQAIAGYIGIFA